MASTNRRVTQNKNVEFIHNLMSGALLDDIKVECERLEQFKFETDASLRRLMSSSRDIVKDAIQDIVDTGSHDEIHALKKVSLNDRAKHANLPLLIESMRVKVPVWIFGDTGSGKTTAAAQAAEMFDLEFRFISVCPTTTKSELFGYMDANGHYNSTAFREIFENGGVFLIDEIDNGNPSILSVLNAALANDACSFPDGNITRHPDALFIAAANTIGRGADTKYVGRNALDATTLDRFVFIRMDIDENMENAISGGEFNNELVTDISEGGKMTMEEWRTFVRKSRKACLEIGLEHIISPRATIYGQKLLGVGVGRQHVEDMCIWKGIRESDRRKIEGTMENYK